MSDNKIPFGAFEKLCKTFRVTVGLRAMEPRQGYRLNQEGRPLDPTEIDRVALYGSYASREAAADAIVDAWGRRPTSIVDALGGLMVLSPAYFDFNL